MIFCWTKGNCPCLAFKKIVLIWDRFCRPCIYLFPKILQCHIYFCRINYFYLQFLLGNYLYQLLYLNLVKFSQACSFLCTKEKSFLIKKIMGSWYLVGGDWEWFPCIFEKKLGKEVFNDVRYKLHKSLKVAKSQKIFPILFDLPKN